MSELTNLTIPQLKKIAKNEGVDLTDKSTKDQLKRAIKYRRKHPCQPGKVLVKSRKRTRCSPGSQPLADMKAAELKQLAREWGVTGWSQMAKATLIARIYAKEQEVGGMPAIMVPAVPETLSARMGDDTSPVSESMEEETDLAQAKREMKDAQEKRVQEAIDRLQFVSEVVEPKEELQSEDDDDDEEDEVTSDEEEDDEGSDLEDETDLEQARREMKDAQEARVQEAIDRLQFVSEVVEPKEEIPSEDEDEEEVMSDEEDEDEDRSIGSEDISDDESDVEVVEEVTAEEALNKKFSKADVIDVDDSDDDESESESESESDEEEDSAEAVRAKLLMGFAAMCIEDIKVALAEGNWRKSIISIEATRMKNEDSITDQELFETYLFHVEDGVEMEKDEAFGQSILDRGISFDAEPTSTFDRLMIADASARTGNHGLVNFANGSQQATQYEKKILVTAYRNLYDNNKEVDVGWSTGDVIEVIRLGKFLRNIKMKEPSGMQISDREYQRDVHKAAKDKLMFYKIVPLMGYKNANKFTQSIAYQISRIPVLKRKERLLEEVSLAINASVKEGSDILYIEQLIDHVINVENYDIGLEQGAAARRLIQARLAEDEFLKTRQKRTMELYVLTYPEHNPAFDGEYMASPELRMEFALKYLSSVNDTFTDRYKAAKGDDALRSKIAAKTEQFKLHTKSESNLKAPDHPRENPYDSDKIFYKNVFAPRKY
jgi:hypothetical protein